MNELKKILVPVDFSENSNKILQSAVFVSGKCDARLSIIYVLQSFDDYSGFFVPHMPIAQFEVEMLEGATKKMESFIHENLASDIPHEAKVLTGDVAEEICSYAKKNSIDMIVMGTHGYRGFEKILFGSVAEKIVKTAPCPVLVINPYK
ncbi:MAG: universal stress protein [Proteobacteria bacterium]|nr:universal stress protein [Pseudomonadota bacterium]MBU1716367.1 universal stress protein [Pseudomonadota bacterium]